jgi:hypothetical protein
VSNRPLKTKKKMETNEKKTVVAPYSAFYEREAKDAVTDIGRVETAIQSCLSVGNVILVLAALLSAYLAGKGFGAIVDDLPHQIAIGFVVFILSMLLGKRATLSVPQVKAWLVYLYCGIMIFISAAFFVLGFVGDEPVRQCIADDLNSLNELTVKYQKEDQKMTVLITNMYDYEKNLRNQAESERNMGTLSGTAGSNGVVYVTYVETADFVKSQREILTAKQTANQETLSEITKTLESFTEVVWDKTLRPTEIQQEAYKREHNLQESFIRIKQNAEMVAEVANSIDDYSKNINTKRADKTNSELKNSQTDVLNTFKESLARFGQNLRRYPFISRDENINTIKISVHDVYVANLMQIPRNFYLWLVGIMLDIAAPLILYIIIGNLIKKRDELQVVLRDSQKKQAEFEVVEGVKASSVAVVEKKD